MRRDGFTVIEMVIAFSLIGIMAAFAYPRIRDAVQKNDVRSARALMATYHAKARYAAIMRRGRSTLHMQDGRVWVTAPPVSGVGLDTLGQVDSLKARFGVELTYSRTQLVFDPRGIGTETSNTTIIVTKGAYADTLVIAPTGRIVH